MTLHAQRDQVRLLPCCCQTFASCVRIACLLQQLEDDPTRTTADAAVEGRRLPLVNVAVDDSLLMRDIFT